MTSIAPPGSRESRGSRNGRGSCPGRCATTCCSGGPPPPTSRCGPRSNVLRSRTWWPPCPVASTSRSARTAPTCPPASGPGSPSPGRSSPAGPWCCWTSRPRTSTRSPKRSSPTPWSGSPPGLRSWWWPTSRPWSPLADHVVTVPVPPAPVKPVESRGVVSTGSSRGRDTTTTERGSTPAGRPEVATDPLGRRLPSRPPRTALRLWGGAALGALAAASGVALTATAGWLIARAAEHPPVLVLAVAIVGVRAFGLARPALRYAERLVSHDAALRLLAERRAAVYDALVPLVPGRLGKQRGDVLTSVVDDVDALVDKHLRVRAPLVTFGLVGLMAVTVATLVLPSAGLVTLGVLLVGGGSAYLAGRAGVAGAEPRLASAARTAGRARRPDAAGRARPARLAGRRPRPRRHRRREPRHRRGREPVGPRPGHRPRSRRPRRGRGCRRDGLGSGRRARRRRPHGPDGGAARAAPARPARRHLARWPTPAPCRSAPGPRTAGWPSSPRPTRWSPTRRPRSTSPPDAPHVVLEGVGASWSGRPVLRDLDLDLRPGTRLGVVGPSGCGKSTLAALLLRFLDPHSGSIRLGGRTSGSSRWTTYAGTVGLVDDDPHVFASSAAREPPARPTGRDRRRDRRRPAAASSWAPGSTRSRRASTRWSATGTPRSRAGSGPGSDSPAPCSPTSRCWSSTSRPRTSTPAPRRRSPTTCLPPAGGRTVVWITHGSIGLDRMEHVLDLGARERPARVVQHRRARRGRVERVAPPAGRLWPMSHPHPELSAPRSSPAAGCGSSRSAASARSAAT